ncbi:MAG TPA: response regulator [Candidatus Andersenbacteria bacterium]|nr:response regulator [Candidatus Andersenbacteria bacterium]
MAKILIVEDDQFIREMYNLVLQKAGHEVTEALDGKVGLNLATEGGYDVILLDLMMPNLDGLGFLQGLKDNPPKKKNGNIIVLSNLAYSDAKDKAIALGAFDFLVKADLDPKDVRAAVDKALKG